MLFRSHNYSEITDSGVLNERHFPLKIIIVTKNGYLIPKPSHLSALNISTLYIFRTLVRKTEYFANPLKGNAMLSSSSDEPAVLLLVHLKDVAVEGGQALQREPLEGGDSDLHEGGESGSLSQPLEVSGKTSVLKELVIHPPRGNDSAFL